MYALEVEKTYRIMLPVIFPWYDQEVVPCQQQQQSQWYHVELKVPDHKKKKLEDRAGKKSDSNQHCIKLLCTVKTNKLKQF